MLMHSYMCVKRCFCDWLFNIVDWVADVWNHGFIEAPLIASDLKDELLNNKDLSNKLAGLHDLLLPWALDKDHPSTQSQH